MGAAGNGPHGRGIFVYPITNGLRAWRDRMVREELVRRFGVVAHDVPDQYLPIFCNYAGALEHALRVVRYLGSPPLRCLVVGTFGGRDFWTLRLFGHDVVGMDLVPNPLCPPCVVADAEQPWPFGDEEFDAIIMGEILEHLLGDAFALQEANRVLKPIGKLIATVPFLSDKDEFHVRVHTPRSIRQLIQNSRFDIAEEVQRPGLYFKQYIGSLAFCVMGGGIFVDASHQFYSERHHNKRAGRPLRKASIKAPRITGTLPPYQMGNNAVGGQETDANWRQAIPRGKPD